MWYSASVLRFELSIEAGLVMEESSFSPRDRLPAGNQKGSTDHGVALGSFEVTVDIPNIGLTKA